MCAHKGTYCVVQYGARRKVRAMQPKAGLCNAMQCARIGEGGEVMADESNESCRDMRVSRGMGFYIIRWLRIMSIIEWLLVRIVASAISFFLVFLYCLFYSFRSPPISAIPSNQ
jgi:hypothetical protein